MELVLRAPSSFDGWVHCARVQFVPAPLAMTPEQEFERFFVAHFDRLVRSLTAMTGDAEAATDAVQEAFIKAYARWSRVSKYDDPILWVRRVAINQNRDSRRSFLRRRSREDRFEGVADERGTVAWESDATIDVADVLRRLSPRQRDIAVLFYLEDLSIAEIATSLDLSAGAVKFHLNKARLSLRTLLAVEERGSHE